MFLNECMERKLTETSELQDHTLFIFQYVKYSSILGVKIKQIPK